MVKRNTNKMSEVEFLSTIGPVLASVQEEVVVGVQHIENTFPKLNSRNYNAMMQKSVAVPYPWFIWLAAAAQFVVQRYELLESKGEGNS